MRRYGNRCAFVEDGERCMIHAPLEVHHRNGRPQDNDPRNLIPVCPSHHRQVQGDDDAVFAEPIVPVIA